MPVVMELQRTENRDLGLVNTSVQCSVGVPCPFHNRRVVQSLNKGEVNCISAGHKEADLWSLVWNKIDACMDKSFD